jgi:hypothetical protein
MMLRLLALSLTDEPTRSLPGVPGRLLNNRSKIGVNPAG